MVDPLGASEEEVKLEFRRTLARHLGLPAFLRVSVSVNEHLWGVDQRHASFFFFFCTYARGKHER